MNEYQTNRIFVAALLQNTSTLKAFNKAGKNFGVAKNNFANCLD